MPTNSNPQFRLAIFASGGGSNAEQIIRYFDGHESISVQLIVSNRKKAKVLARADSHGIASKIVNRAQLAEGCLLDTLEVREITHIVLAGFLLLIPKELISLFPDKIINIHPSLLPKYGGRGMYGKRVHEAVHSNQESVSGMTIHLVNEEYDKGEILFQEEVQLNPTDSPSDIAAKVLTLEHHHYSRVIEQFILKDLNI